ncbi:flagellar biosynthesis regulator FlaF [Belnapia sp. F-4-1]|uniref:flagellar biosynthesis regulator FlaF n=1 Tax=Belnapia sp. F-4-1 TaxID=1545443 RepID=UPI0005BCE401|nr:flagellar biosynthesis regulator FlaF [Belnapia sp. F-4-1]
MFPDSETETQAHRGAAAYRRRLSSRQMEAEVFARANRAIRESRDGGPLARARAVADNRRLWDAVQAAVIDPTNALPTELRASIAGVAMAVLRECGTEEPDLDFVAEMNDHFAAALWR